MSILPLTLMDGIDMSPPQNMNFHKIRVHAKHQVSVSSSLNVINVSLYYYSIKSCGQYISRVLVYIYLTVNLNGVFDLNMSPLKR